MLSPALAGDRRESARAIYMRVKREVDTFNFVTFEI